MTNHFTKPKSYSLIAMARNLDMFSFLPESLLVIIVSFLPFKEAARTCILSKQWLELWKSTRNIEFNELFFVKPGESDETKEAQRRVFLNFITHWIANYKDQVVDKFSLKVSAPENISDIIERCVAFATQRGVKELGLDFSDPNWKEKNFENHGALFELPKHIYRHGSIESLKLYSCNFVMLDLLNFKALKDVSLGWIEVSIYNLQTLLSTCKTIENLSLKKCWNLEHFDMSDEKLRLTRLVIDKCDFGVDCFRFNAPNLKFFKYSGLVGVFDIDVQRFVMEEAEIDFALVPHYGEFGNELYKLLEDLYPVRVLTVDSYLLQVIPSGDEPVSIQCDLNVRHLILKTQLHSYELCGFLFLLNSCPMLEKLILEIDSQLIFPNYVPPYPINFKKFWSELQITCPICLETTLKVVEVKRFRWSKAEVKALCYLIRFGIVLEKININVLKEENVDSKNVNGRRKIERFILTAPKASRNLQISIS